MAKLFYSLEEAAQKLGKTPDQVKEMASKGQLEQFRDRDKLMFKREQVDLLAGGGAEEDVIPLADSGELEPLTAASSGTGVTETPKESTGISIFDADATDDADANAVTRVTQSPGPLVDPGESKSKTGSGGLLDLTKEADDTSLGAGLLEDVYGGETVAQQTAANTAMGAGAGEALFETPGAETTETSAAPVMMVAEAYDGAGSGLVGGAAIAATVSLAVGIFALLVAFTSTAGGGLIGTLGDSFLILLGVMGGVTILAVLLGWVLGKKS